jgi:site-specific recombinase XerD
MIKNLLPLDRLIEEAQQKLVDLGYSIHTRNQHRRNWRLLMSWAQEHGVQTLTRDFTNQFLESLGIPSGKPILPLRPRQVQIRASIRLLEDFSLYGCWRLYHPVKPAKSFPFPATFEVTAKEFLNYREVQHGLSSSTIYKTKLHLSLFASFLESCRVQGWADITPRNISEFFVASSNFPPATLAHIVSSLRQFFKYLWLHGLHSQDISPYLPQIRRQEHEHIPSVWKQKDVEAILAAVDRSSPLGKRDYAILILATRLGLRVGEIKTLKLEYIHWERATIEVFQPKTGTTVLLPLSEEIGQALIDYLRNGRPSIVHREVFVRHAAPFNPFSQNTRLYHIITNYRRKAHVPAKTSGHQGLHSLRYTLATNLLEQGTTMETIAAILGHQSVETTQIYTKVNLTALRSTALDPEEVCHEQIK